MKVLLVNGSPREKNTFSVLKNMENILQRHNIETKTVSIQNYNIKNCIGCYACVTAGGKSCPFSDDDASILWNDFIDSDAIVLASPVFALGVPGVFKNFMDRIAYNAHRPVFYNKPAILVSTTAGMGTQNVFSQLSWFEICGLRIVAKVGLLVYPIGRDKEKTRMKKINQIENAVSSLIRANNPKRLPAPKLLQVIQFYGLKLNCEFGKEIYKADYEYFNGKSFFIDHKVSPVKRAVGKLVYKMGYNALAGKIEKT
jgi:multimeric flavodoxin WrbA